MKLQRQLSADDVTPNLTPLIDVVFLLLIFFMVTTTFSRDTSLQVELPEADAEPAAANQPQVDLLISRNGNYSVNGRLLVNNRLETLMRALTEVSGGDNSLPLVVSADAQASHQSVVRAMDAAAQLGFGRLSIATREAETENP